MPFLHQSQTKPRTLVVLIPGMAGRQRVLDSLTAVIKESLPDADVLTTPFDTNWWSNADPLVITRDLLREIDGAVKSRQYERLTLVGYSMGGVIARKIVVCAWGEHTDAPFEDVLADEKGRRPWASLIGRVVLVAGVSRGWSFAPTWNIAVNAFLQFLYTAARLLGRAGLLASVRRGAPFVTDLRVQWLSLLRNEPAEWIPTVVQLLGTVDDVVSPEDTVDLETGSDFLYLEVPASGHKNLVEFAERGHGQVRRQMFARALTAGREELSKESDPAFNYALRGRDANVDHVLFVVHGIRDYGFWTAHLARHVTHRAAQAGIRMTATTPAYGYFAMLPFILPSTRRAKIRWFMDQYTHALALYPNAKWISYIGHSNGTYLLAGALRDYRTCHFHHVVFAGSVVRADFDWPHYLGKGRVHKVLNYVATADWVVAIFPRFLGRLGMDVGGAGHDGFGAGPELPGAPVMDAEFIIGRHSTAIREFNWSYIANFVIDGRPPPKTDRFAEAPNKGVRLLGMGAPIAWAALLAFALWPELLFVVSRAGGWQVNLSLGGWAFVCLAWFLIARGILTRV
jgi:hypothetical protein